MSTEISNTSDINTGWQEQEDFHCITCSDQALPARVLSIDAGSGLAQVELGGATEEIDISLVEAVEAGDTLLVHGGVALERTSNT